jgi:hypothetical protein
MRTSRPSWSWTSHSAVRHTGSCLRFWAGSESLYWAYDHAFRLFGIRLRARDRAPGRSTGRHATESTDAALDESALLPDLPHVGPVDAEPPASAGRAAVERRSEAARDGARPAATSSAPRFRSAATRRWLEPTSMTRSQRTRVRPTFSFCVGASGSSRRSCWRVMASSMRGRGRCTSIGQREEPGPSRRSCCPRTGSPAMASARRSPSAVTPPSSAPGPPLRLCGLRQRRYGLDRRTLRLQHERSGRRLGVRLLEERCGLE